MTPSHPPHPHPTPLFLHCMLIYNAHQIHILNFSPAHKLFGQELKLSPTATDKATLS